MIVSVTMNPSIDMAYPLPHFALDEVNRAASVIKTAGGKGLNVTRVLHELGAQVTATGLTGGRLGQFIIDRLNDDGIQHDFYQIAEESRNSIAILHDGGKQTEILEAGPTVSEEELAGFLASFQQLVKTAAVVTLSGSLPKGVPSDFYVKLIEAAKAMDVPVLLDTSGDSLAACVHATQQPFLIKPNVSELQALLGTVLGTEAELRERLRMEPLLQGIDWVVISMGAAGALAKHGQQLYSVSIPKVAAVNPVGSGDATIAGLAWAIEQKQPPEELLKSGMTAGILNALEHQTGHINKQNYQQIYENVVVQLVSD